MPDLYRPTRDGFLAMAADSAVVPVWREVLADLYTPLGVYDRLRGDGTTFLLESVEQGVLGPVDARVAPHYPTTDTSSHGPTSAPSSCIE